jgi:hypothetical protein
MTADSTTRAPAATTSPVPASPEPVPSVPATTAQPTEQPTEHHVEVIEAAVTGEDNESDFDPVDFDAESSNTSITSSIFKHSYENGRR